MDIWMYDGQTDRHTDLECETIIPCHYCVAGYKNPDDDDNDDYYDDDDDNDDDLIY